MAKRTIMWWLVIWCSALGPAVGSAMPTLWPPALNGPVDTVDTQIPCQDYILLDSTYLIIQAQDGCDSVLVNYTTELGDCVSCGDQCIYITGATSISGGESDGAEVIVTYTLNGDTLISARSDWTGEVDQVDCFLATDQLDILTVEARIPVGASGSATASAWIVTNPGAAMDTTFTETFTCLPQEAGFQLDTLRTTGGCDSLVFRTTTLLPQPEVFLFDEAACAGDTVTLFADGTVAGTYTWSTGQTGEVLQTATPGSYAVTLTDNNGCSANASAEVILSEIDITFAPSIAGPLWLNEDPVQVWEGAAVELQAILTGTSPNYDILWNGGPEIGDSILNFVAQASDTITVAVIDENGCFAQSSIPIEVVPANIFVPNAFSPNGDLINDEFGIYTSPNVEEVQLQLFQRQGAMLIDVSPRPIPSGEDALYWPIWDGNFRQESLTPQVFTWQLRYRLYRGEWRTLAGELTLIR